MTTDEAPVAVTETPKRKTSATPVADQNLADCANTVADVWIRNPAITAIWITSAGFKTTTNLFGTSLGDRHATGGGRAAVTNELKLLDKEINQKQDYIKVYLKDKYDKDTFTAYLPQFGIVMEHKKWSFPADRNKRLAALKLAVQALVAHDFQDKKFGLEYWQDIYDRYETALQLSVSTDGEVAGLVSAKNEYRKQIQKALNALIHIIKGNYPDTYAGVLREWGFQKEKY